MIDPSAADRGLQVMEPLPPAEAEAADMLLSLPAHLLDDILTRLDLSDAVRTSVLSCAWRRRWESILGLALSFPEGTRPLVIARVLLRYTGSSISRFACYVDDPDGVDDWVITLSRRSVQSISIANWMKSSRSPVFLNLHSSIFSCDCLVSLNLQNFIIPPVPRSGFLGFPVLQELYLSCVKFIDGGGLQAIIRGSPILRVLELEEVYLQVGCVIEAPNLQTLKLDLQHDEGWHWQCGRLPRLQYAMIDVHMYVHGGHRLLELFAGVSQVQELRLYSPANMREVKIDRIPFTFHNLKRLEISIYTVYMEFILLLFSLLRRSPNLVELKIEIGDDTDSDISEEWTNAQWTDGMCSNLQIVQIESPFKWVPLSLMKLILSKASLLRIFSMDFCPHSQDDPLNELLKCRRASAHAQVLFKEDLDSNDTDWWLSE